MRVDSIVVPTQPDGNPDNTTVVPAEAEPAPTNAEGNPDSSTVIPAKAGIQGRGAARPSKAGPHPEPVLSTVEGPSSSVTPAKGLPSLPQLTTNNQQLETPPARRPRTRRTRTQRRRDGNARAALRRKALGSERIEKEKDEQHWHEPDPLWRAHRLHTPRPLTPLVTPTRLHNRIATVEGGLLPPLP